MPIKQEGFSLEESEHEREPLFEEERKYILDSAEDLRRLETKIRLLFPDTRFIGGYSEISHYFASVTKAKATQLLTLVQPGNTELLARLAKVPEDVPIAPRLRQRKNFEDNNLIFTLKASRNPLHDEKRIEIATSDINKKWLEGFAARGLKLESQWHAQRREYAIDDHTKIDVEDVTGYGWISEIEADTLDRVDEVGGQLSLQPLSEEELNAMYQHYIAKGPTYFYHGGRHFGEDDWRDIELVLKHPVRRNQIR